MQRPLYKAAFFSRLAYSYERIDAIPNGYNSIGLAGEAGGQSALTIAHDDLLGFVFEERRNKHEGE
jgi:hypothetical protein